MNACFLSRVMAAYLILGPLALRSAPAAPPEIAPAINELGLDLYRQQIKSARGGNVLTSPYSISTALAMAYTGADGATREEMQRVLHLPGDQATVGAAFHALAGQLAEMVSYSEKLVAEIKAVDVQATPIQQGVANRLYAQRGYELRPAFVENLRTQFNSTLEELVF